MFCLCRQPNKRKYLRSGEYKQNLCSYDYLLSGFMIGAFQFVLDTPKCYGKSPNGQQRTDSTGVSPSDGLPEPPSLPATVLSRSDCDWTGVPLFSLWVMAKSEAIRYFQSVMNEITPFHRSLLLNRSWRTAAHAYAHHNHKEEVFGEWIFGCQGSLPFSPHKAKQVEGI